MEFDLEERRKRKQIAVYKGAFTDVKLDILSSGKKETISYYKSQPEICSCLCDHNIQGEHLYCTLYNKKLATYGEGDTFDQSAAEGFIKLWGLPYKQQK